MSLKRTAAAFAALSFAALAATPSWAVTYEFAHEGNTFATLDVTSGPDGYLLFDLQAPGLDVFGSQSFLGALAVGGARTGTALDVMGGAPVSIQSGGGPGGDYGFRFDLTGPRQARLTDGESVQWTWVGSGRSADSLSLNAHIQGIGINGQDSLWVTPTTPIPEPETYALMLAGLGVVGTIARRRKQAQSSLGTPAAA